MVGYRFTFTCSLEFDIIELYRYSSKPSTSTSTPPQGRIQEFALSGPSPFPLLFTPPLPSLLSHSFPFPFFPVPSFPFPSPPILSLSLFALSLPLEVGPLFAARESGGALKLPQRVRRSPAAKRFLVNCRLKIAPVVAMVTKETSAWSIAKKPQYVTLYVNHNIPSIVQWDPKVLVLLWLERRRPAQTERHTKRNTSLVLQGDFSRL